MYRGYQRMIQCLFFFCFISGTHILLHQHFVSYQYNQYLAYPQCVQSMVVAQRPYGFNSIQTCNSMSHILSTF
uniref:Putative secreted protein n=1 Tax=Anopheles darlingi TaxID=43151 RepID=A0A2M4D8L4_ANODA